MLSVTVLPTSNVPSVGVMVSQSGSVLVEKLAMLVNVRQKICLREEIITKINHFSFANIAVSHCGVVTETGCT